jgi:hypothetical protein
MASPHTRNIITLAVLEGLVLMSASMRFAFPELGGVDLSRTAHLVWFVGVVLLAGGAVALYVIRSAALAPRLQAGERLDDELKQLLAMSVAVLGFSGLVSFAGPQLFERFLG